eukprot:2705422-Rhodomonas_salina.1
MSGTDGAFIIPVPIIQHFLKDIEVGNNESAPFPGLLSGQSSCVLGARVCRVCCVRGSAHAVKGCAKNTTRAGTRWFSL